ncbi:hypothetical protein KR100_01595 [Synechococcus sp. KORDI-100]|nr:hypothetical protein KR100_01595 [Synechococcus sp. KORDI-100]
MPVSREILTWVNMPPQEKASIKPHAQLWCLECIAVVQVFLQGLFRKQV